VPQPSTGTLVVTDPFERYQGTRKSVKLVPGETTDAGVIGLAPYSKKASVRESLAHVENGIRSQEAPTSVLLYHYAWLLGIARQVGRAHEAARDLEYDPTNAEEVVTKLDAFKQALADGGKAHQLSATIRNQLSERGLKPDQDVTEVLRKRPSFRAVVEREPALIRTLQGERQAWIVQMARMKEPQQTRRFLVARVVASDRAYTANLQQFLANAQELLASPDARRDEQRAMTYVLATGVVGEALERQRAECLKVVENARQLVLTKD
jgi:hypothetical protein